jgi:uncharacterized protein (DUF1330 family)
MKTRFALTIALAGTAAGALAAQAIHAQSKPLAYVITEIQVSDPDAYRTEYAPKVAKVIQDAGAKYLARGGKIVTLDGEPPQGRVVVLEFENLAKLDKAVEWRNSAAHKELIPIATNIPKLAHSSSKECRAASDDPHQKRCPFS